MGVAGGMVPSPSAVVVLLGAAALGHAWFGVVLVIGYGAGMALVLALAGLVVVRLSERIQHWLIHRGRSQLLRAFPVVTAAAVIVLGAVLAVRGVASALAG
jgi:nickel/cobalt transporter (NicO) family protein